MQAMVDQKHQAQRFGALHVRGTPLILFNVWDAGSARAVTAGGAQAIATGSWSVAEANGFADGEQIPLPLAMENLRRIVAATTLPVSVDLESGYGDTAQAVGETIRQAIDAGAVGCNLEDSFPADGKLREASVHAQRILRARQVADAANIRFFINARTDVFFQRPPAQHDSAMVAAALERARHYADAGADGVFVPGLIDIKLIARIATAAPLPLNILIGEGSPTLRVLAEHGVARVSHGPGPYLMAMKAVENAARSVVEQAQPL